jgi:hypothetical protein
MGRLMNLSQCNESQRDAIAKLEGIHGGAAVTITDAGPCDWSYQGREINVIFDTGPRRLDFVTAHLDSMGWRYTGDDWVRVMTHADHAMKIDAA